MNQYMIENKKSIYRYHTEKEPKYSMSTVYWSNLALLSPSEKNSSLIDVKAERNLPKRDS